jgi:hypothetical protein
VSTGVLVLEIAAGRLLASYVGVSLPTYTGIIGAILAGPTVHRRMVEATLAMQNGRNHGPLQFTLTLDTRGLLIPTFGRFYKDLTNDYMDLEAEGMKRAAESA